MNKTHKNKTLILLSFLSALISCYTLLLPQNSYAGDSICASVKIEIGQELTLERQAFDAHMRITNGLDIVTLEDVDIDIYFTDEDGNAVAASSDPDNTSALFYIRVDSTENIDDVNGAGTVQPETTADIHWLIIPAPGSSNGLEMGTLYYVGATLTYTIGGEQEVTEVSPDYIFVKPMPELTLDYFLPTEVYGDDAFTTEIEPVVPFTLGVRVKNTGAGTAKDLKIESAQPKIVENEQGLLIGFNIEGSEVNGQDATDSLLADFGDIEPNRSGIARWIMTVSLSGQFVEFDAEYTHADELGGKLTSLINDPINTHFLVHDVLVDLTGRDNIRDFLAKDGGVYKVYESESIDTEVTDQTALSNLQYSGQTGSEISYILSTPVTAGFMYVKLPDPQNGQDVIKRVLRSDGKFINEENAWLSKTRDESDNWVYYINFFDDNTTDSYTVVFEDPSSGPQPPELQFIPDRSGFESRQISFIVEASDPNSTIPMLSAAPLPAGATFTDQGDTGNGIATGIFDWTPSEGQSGKYEITFTAFDGLYTDTERAVITINLGTDTDSDGMPDDWEINYFGDITRDGTGDYDNDGLSDLDEYLSGTDPTNPDTDGDNMPDGWETAHGLNPNFNDAAEDPDNDGYSNLEEYEGGSDPFDPESIPDRVPVANAGPDQNVMTGETATLDGSGSNDPERAMITFLWSFTDVPAGSLVNNDSLTDTAGAKPEFIPDVNGTYRLSLTVNDGISDSTQDEVLITASVSNVAPNADAGPDRNALTGSLVNIDGSRS
ncbi:MAG TPA: hypothetical protein ENH01_02895, partial [Nitrospirae bacterium]|nr:hypothetical protein [Nitrospirota bacterium]